MDRLLITQALQYLLVKRWVERQRLTKAEKKLALRLYEKAK